MAVTNPRMDFDGRYRFTIVQDGGTIYIYRYEGFTGNVIPFVDGSLRKSVMTADAADLAVYHNFIVVDNTEKTMVSADRGESWKDRTDG